MKDEDIKLPEMVNLSVSEDWHNSIGEYARQAVRMNAACDRVTKDNANSWLAVSGALNAIIPGWLGDGGHPYKYAIETIQNLAEKAAAATQKPSDPEPFDLARAMAGEPIVTRDGRKARFVAHVPEAEDYKVVAFVEGERAAINYTESGVFELGADDYIFIRYDLFMAPKPKRTVWVNVWKNGFGNIVASGHTTKEEALYCVQNSVTTALMKKAHPIEIDATE